MIVRLRGALAEIDGNRITIDVGGVGYEVAVPISAIPRLGGIGDEVKILTRQVFREDGQFLFGFLEPFERRIFDLLTDVKGCGPKISLALLGELGVEAVVASISTQDTKMLARAPGIGIRMAERIVVELKDKIQQEMLAHKISHAVIGSHNERIPLFDDEVTEALVALGYRRQEAEQAANQVADPDQSTEERILAALRTLKK